MCFITKLKNGSFEIKNNGEVEIFQIYGKNIHYESLRKTEYPKIEEQLDMIYWDKINGTNNWLEKISNIKEKFKKV